MSRKPGQEAGMWILPDGESISGPDVLQPQWRNNFIQQHHHHTSSYSIVNTCICDLKFVFVVPVLIECFTYTVMKINRPILCQVHSRESDKP